MKDKKMNDMTQNQAQAYTLRFISPDEEATRIIASSLAGVLESGLVITLDGELGAGKTNFVRGLAEGLGLATDYVSSPTFTIVQEYEDFREDEDGQESIVNKDLPHVTPTPPNTPKTPNTPNPPNTHNTSSMPSPKSLPLFHFDVYRLANSEAFTDLGLDEYFHRRGVILIEWAGRIEEILPTDRVVMDLAVEGLNVENINVEPPSVENTNIEITSEDEQVLSQTPDTDDFAQLLQGGSIELAPDLRPRIFTFRATGEKSQKILQAWQLQKDFPQGFLL